MIADRVPCPRCGAALCTVCGACQNSVCPRVRTRCDRLAEVAPEYGPAHNVLPRTALAGADVTEVRSRFARWLLRWFAS